MITDPALLADLARRFDMARGLQDPKAKKAAMEAIRAEFKAAGHDINNAKDPMYATLIPLDFYDMVVNNL